MYHTTYHGLEKWFVHVFESFGWMTLAKNQKRTVKITAYKDSVKNLHAALRERLAVTKDAVHKMDLENLLYNVAVLEKAIKTMKL
jgi:hypothetical protein